MRHEKIVKREDGVELKITASLFVDFSGIKYCIENVTIRHKGKRKWDNAISKDDYSYRRIPFAERPDYELNQYLKFVTMQELNDAKNELWQLIKP
jgi:hypothetical protein